MGWQLGARSLQSGLRSRTRAQAGEQTGGTSQVLVVDFPGWLFFGETGSRCNVSQPYLFKDLAACLALALAMSKLTVHCTTTSYPVKIGTNNLSN